MKCKLSLLLLLLSAIVSSCNKEDLTPSYVIITKEDLQNSILMNQFNLSQGSDYPQEKLDAIANHDFTHVEFFVNGNNLGVYSLPCKIPVLSEGSTKLLILPCFRMNGMSSTIRTYAGSTGMVAPFETTVMLKKGENYTFDQNPIFFEFYNGIRLPIIETFDNSTTFSPSDTATSPPIEITNLEGASIGLVTIDHARGNFEIISPELSLPGLGKNLFLEFNYKCDQEMYVAIMTQNQTNSLWVQHSLIGIKSTNVWKKMYVNLTDITSIAAGGYSTVKSKILFSGNSLEASSAKFYFDNIKVIYVE